jgi:GTP pyrophosphokinase
VSAKSIAARAARELADGDPGREVHLSTSPQRPVRRRRTEGKRAGIHVEGMDAVMVKLSRCCTPVPGDDIMGFVTRGRGVSVHRTDCANGLSLSTVQSERVIEVEWDDHPGDAFVASVEVDAFDRERLLGDVGSVLADHHINIVSSEARTGRDRVCHMTFEFELADPSHLDSLLASLNGIESVYAARRVLPGRKSG